MKSHVRSEILKSLKSLSPDQKKYQSILIQNNLKQVLQPEQGLWLAFQNLSDEPEINWNDVSDKIEWAFPKLQEKNLDYIKSVNSFKKSALGFAEPENGIKIELQDIQGVILPGVAFDHQGHRLGRGKGFYDRALAEFAGLKYGVCFENSFYKEVPHESHDIQCDKIITSSQIYNVNKAEGVKKWN